MELRLGIPVHLRTAIALLLLPLHLLACTSWRVSEGGPPEVIAQRPERVQLKLTDGSSLVIFEPRIESDSVVGLDDWTASTRRGVPLSSIREIAVARRDDGKTVLLIAAIVFVPIAVYAALLSQCGECE